jgi:hypothetical protein
MRQNSRINSKQTKELARRKYAERQIDKFIKWSFEQRGFVKYKDIVRYQNEYNIKCYG